MVGDVGGWGEFGGFGGRVGKLGWETGLSKAYPEALDKPLISPYQFSTNPEQTLDKDLLFHSWLDQRIKAVSLALGISDKPLLGSYMISYLTPPLPPQGSMIQRIVKQKPKVVNWHKPTPSHHVYKSFPNGRLAFGCPH